MEAARLQLFIQGCAIMVNGGKPEVTGLTLTVCSIAGMVLGVYPKAHGLLFLVSALSIPAFSNTKLPNTKAEIICGTCGIAAIFGTAASIIHNIGVFAGAI